MAESTAPDVFRCWAMWAHGRNGYGTYIGVYPGFRGGYSTLFPVTVWEIPRDAMGTHYGWLGNGRDFPELVRPLPSLRLVATGFEPMEARGPAGRSSSGSWNGRPPMPETTTRRVSLHFLIATDRAPEDVHLAILASVSDRFTVLHSGVGSYDMNDPDEPSVQLVIDPVAGIRGAFVDDPERAEELAKELGSVIVELTVDTDLRGEVNR